MPNNKLIEELIIKVKQQGAKPTEKSLRSVTEAVESASAHIKVLNGQLKMTPKLLGRIEQSSAKAANKLKNIQFGGGGSAVSEDLGYISRSLEDLTAEVVESNQILTKINNNTIASYKNLSGELGVSLERVEDGLIDVRKEAGRTDKALDSTEKSSRRSARGMANASRQGRNQSRTLGDLVKSAGPLPLLYANIAANVFAVSEAFRQLSAGEQLNRLEEVGTIMGAQIGVPVQNIAQRMNELTGNTIGYATALRQASAVAAYGFRQDDIEKLTLAARRASIALGVDMQDALNRVIKGTSKLEIELLDELGITTKLTTAYGKYAEKIGVSAMALNEYQKRQALVNEINEQSVNKLGALNDMVSDGAPWERLGANAATAWDKVIANISSATSGIAEFLNKNAEGNKEIDSSTEKVDNLAKSMLQANTRAGKFGLLEETSKSIDDLERKLQKLVAQDDSGWLSESRLFGSPTIQRNNIRESLSRLKSMRGEVAKELGTADVSDAAGAYSNLAIAVKSTRMSYDSSLATLKGQSKGYEKIFNDVKSLQQAYLDLEAADPGADLGKAIEKLGFDSETALNKAVMLAKTYRNVNRELQSFSSFSNKTSLQGMISGEDEAQTQSRILERRLSLNQQLLNAQKALGANASEIASTEAKVAKTKQDIIKNNIALIDLDTKRAKTAWQHATALEPELLQQKAVLKVQERRLSKLREIEGSTRAQEETLNRIRQLKDNIASSELAQSTSLMNSALGNLASFAPGIDQLNSSLTTLASSFNTVGESSLTATQMTSMGLQAFQGMLQYTSNQAMQTIDAQINAEKTRDGKSKESVQKIKALEAKKIKEQQKSAKQQILISTAVATMNAAANPWPVPAIPLMAAAALAGGLALSQASSATSNQMSGASKDPNISLTMGKRSSDVDVSQRASAGELSYLRGERGVGSASSFTPRAAGGVSGPGTSMLVGENGPEIVTPTTNLETNNMNDSSGTPSQGSSQPVQFNISAIDAQSFLDRAPDIFTAVETEANTRGFSLGNT